MLESGQVYKYLKQIALYAKPGDSMTKQIKMNFSWKKAGGGRRQLRYSCPNPFITTVPTPHGFYTCKPHDPPPGSLFWWLNWTPPLPCFNQQRKNGWTHPRTPRAPLRKGGQMRLLIQLLKYIRWSAHLCQGHVQCFLLTFNTTGEKCLLINVN